MPTYLVQWENELYHCETPLEAAKACAEDISNGNCLAFTVINLKTEEKWSVDLNDLEGEEVVEISND